jgi:RNA polymerase sigma-70 factor (ECF subfamily)
MSSSGPESDPHHRPLAEGDFMRLLMRHEPALRVFSRALLPDWNAVDEVIQEASLTLWEKFGQLREEEGFLPWAKVVVPLNANVDLPNTAGRPELLAAMAGKIVAKAAYVGRFRGTPTPPPAQ